MKDDDSTDRYRDFRKERPFGTNRGSRGGNGFERLFEDLTGSIGRLGGADGKAKFEKIMRDVSSWFDDGHATRGAGARDASDADFRADRSAGGAARPVGPDAGDAGGASARTTGQARDDDYADEDGGASDSFRGRGPRNYRRSDERIAELVNDALQDDVLDASDIEVSVENGDVTLGGTVTSRRHKHRAENVAVRVSGVHDVDNRVRVKRAGHGDGAGGTPGGTPGEARRDADDYGHS